MKTKLLWLAVPLLIWGGSIAWGVTILSVAGSNGSQVNGGSLSQGTLNNIYTDLATINAALGGSGSINVAAGKTFTVSNTLTLAGTDGTTMTFPTTSATVARTDAANTFTGTQTIGALVDTTVNGNTITTGTGTLTLGSGVITMPNATVSMIGTGAQACGATATCSATAATSQKVVTGSGTLVSGTPSTFALTGISPAFTSSSTYLCNAVDTTTVATSIGVLTAGYVSGSAVTFTGPNTNTDTFRYSCVGN